MKTDMRCTGFNCGFEFTVTTPNPSGLCPKCGRCAEPVVYVVLTNHAASFRISAVFADKSDAQTAAKRLNEYALVKACPVVPPQQAAS